MAKAQSTEVYDPERIYQDDQGGYRLSRYGGRIPHGEVGQPPVKTLKQLTIEGSPLDASKRTRLLIARLQMLAKEQELVSVVGGELPVTVQAGLDEMANIVDRAWEKFHGHELPTLAIVAIINGLKIGARLNMPDAAQAALLHVCRHFPEHAATIHRQARDELECALALWARTRGNPGKKATGACRYRALHNLLKKIGLDPPSAATLKDMAKKMK